MTIAPQNAVRNFLGVLVLRLDSLVVVLVVVLVAFRQQRRREKSKQLGRQADRQGVLDVFAFQCFG